MIPSLKKAAFIVGLVPEILRNAFVLSFAAEEERAESTEQPGAQRQVRRPLASTAQDDQLLLEQEILRHHRSHTTGATELRGHDGQVQQGEQEVPHVRVSVGQTSGATQRCLNPRFGERIGNSRRTGFESIDTSSPPKRCPAP